MHTQCFLERNIRYCHWNVRKCLHVVWHQTTSHLPTKTECSNIYFPLYWVYKYFNVSCKTKNVVNLLQCLYGMQYGEKKFSVYVVFNMQYVGEKEQSFNKRKNGHWSDCTCKPDLPISFHVRPHEHVKADLKSLTIINIDHNEDRSNAQSGVFWI